MKFVHAAVYRKRSLEAIKAVQQFLNEFLILAYVLGEIYDVNKFLLEPLKVALCCLFMCPENPALLDFSFVVNCRNLCPIVPF